MNIKKIVLRTMPYVCIALYGTKIGQAWRLAAGTAFAEKFLHWGDGFMQALASPLPSFHPQDVLAGMAIAMAFYATVYVNSKIYSITLVWLYAVRALFKPRLMAR